jgi:hypothetical protein
MPNGLMSAILSIRRNGARSSGPFGRDHFVPTTELPARLSASPPPNTRVQRTRSSASPPHSPLTRYPLGGG